MHNHIGLFQNGKGFIKEYETGSEGGRVEIPLLSGESDVPVPKTGSLFEPDLSRNRFFKMNKKTIAGFFEFSPLTLQIDHPVRVNPVIGFISRHPGLFAFRAYEWGIGFHLLGQGSGDT